MRPPNNRRRGAPAALWSELFALWRVATRRPAWPLLLALLLFVVAPIAAPMNCSPEASGHAHGAVKAHGHDDADHHHADEPHDHGAVAHVDASQSAIQAPASCCSCSSEPVNAVVAALPAPHHSKADSHAVFYATAHALPVYRFDTLRGLNARAGPPTGKPQLLSLASLIGRAPPVSL